MLIGAPVALSMIASALLGGAIAGIPLSALTLQLSNSILSYPLLAVPFFILLGNLMNAFKLTERLFAFASSLVGHIRGGLAQVNVLASMIFAGMSGSAAADTAGLGLIEIKAMDEARYERSFSVGVTLASSVIGPIIPPSVTLILYGVLAEVSIMKLFLAGLVPGILIGLMIMLTNWYLVISNRVKVPASQPFEFQTMKKTASEGMLTVLAPMIVLGGMVGGMVTPTEAGVVAVLYCIIVALLYRTFSFERLKSAMIDSAHSFSEVMFLLAAGSAMGWIFTAEQLPSTLLDLMMGWVDGKMEVLILVTVVLLVVGMFMDGLPAMIILMPMILPLVKSVGVDPIHFGIIVAFNTTIGMITPPIGLNLFVISSVVGVPYGDAVKGVFPFMFPLLLALALITFLPTLSLWLPSLFS